LFEGLKYIEKVSTQLGMEFIVFDYTGYGCSAIKSISEASIREDLEVVLAWITGTVELERVVLWGFSLGTYPVAYCASKYEVRGVILQSPIASIGCAFK
jgi:pimeloyl-ACP methyl ester carboxylesterase